MNKNLIKIIKIVFLIAALLVATFCVKKLLYKPSKATYTVIHIIDADKFYVDFNKNDKPDLDEIVKLSAVNSLKPSFAQYLEEQLNYIGIDKASGVLVRHFETDRLKDFNRITIGNKEQMDIFLNTVKTILEAVK